MNSVEILIADDQELFRRMVRLNLTAIVSVAKPVMDRSIEKVRELRPDTVLMNINTPPNGRSGGNSKSFDVKFLDPM
jgi:CheY-like chemotaxis protein